MADTDSAKIQPLINLYQLKETPVVLIFKHGKLHSKMEGSTSEIVLELIIKSLTAEAN